MRRDDLAGWKNKRALASLATDSGVDADYLVLLRRAVGGFFPKPKPLRAFDWLNEDVVTRLEDAGAKNTQQFRDAASAGLSELAEQARLSDEDFWLL